MDITEISAANVVAAIVENYGATTCAIDKNSFLRAAAAAFREGSPVGENGFNVASNGETYHFHTVTVESFGRNRGKSVTYRMEQF